MAVVSDDHADESYNAENCLSSSSQPPATAIRYFTPEEVEQHNKDNGDQESSLFSYWACIDGFVVDATDYIHKHPGGKTKILTSNNASTGDSGRKFDFSLSKGRNAHFPDTARIFRDGVATYLGGGSPEVVYPGTYKGQKSGKLIILGRLRRE